VHVVGELTAAGAPRLQKLCETVLDRTAARTLTVDLSGVRHFEPEGVAVLLQIRDRCAAAGAVLALGGVSDRRGALPLRVERLLDEVDAPSTVRAGAVLA
jgi:anti-anti-sigma factor